MKMKPPISVLIDKLTHDLTPVGSTTPTLRQAMLWWLGSWIYVAVLSWWVQPFRPGALGQLRANPQFAIETLIGLAAGLLVALLAFSQAVPGATRSWLKPAAIVLTAIWIGGYLGGLAAPALVPSMDGKRALCFLEVAIHAALPLLTGWLLLRRGFFLTPQRTGLAIGAAAGMLPGLLMQLACLYQPAHILSHHIAPIAVTALSGWMLGAWHATGPRHS